jgi:hypothetical protein
MSSPKIQLSKVKQINMRFRSFALSTLSIVALLACGSSAAKKDAPINSDAVPGTEPGSSDTPAGPSEKASDSGSVSSPDTGVDAGPHAPTNQAECVAVCESKYPTPAALNKQLDSQCFLAGACEHVCNDLAPGGKLFGVSPPDPDGGVAACVIGENTDPIMTPSAACSDCIASAPACCTLWKNIFGSADGRDLNKCAVKCFTDFKN